VTDRIARSFSYSATRYDDYARLQIKLLDDIFGRLKSQLFEEMTVLDLGCGTGYFLSKIRDYNPDIILKGVDIAPGMIKRCSQRGLNCELATMEKLPYKDDTIDIVTSSFSIHWVEDIDKVFREMARVLKPGGKFFISFPIAGTFKELEEAFIDSCGGYPQKHKFMTREQVEKTMSQAGVEPNELEVKHFDSSYSSLKEAMNSIKEVGAATSAVRTNISKSSYRQIEDYFLKKYQKVIVSYQIVTILGDMPN